MRYLCVQSFSCLLSVSDGPLLFEFVFILSTVTELQRRVRYCVCSLFPACYSFLTEFFVFCLNLFGCDWDWERSEILCVRSFSCLLSICDRSFLCSFSFGWLWYWDFVCAVAFLPIIHFWHTFVVCIRPPLAVTETDWEPSESLCTQSFSYYLFLTGLCCVRPPSAIKLRLNQWVFFILFFKYVCI